MSSWQSQSMLKPKVMSVQFWQSQIDPMSWWNLTDSDSSDSVCFLCVFCLIRCVVSGAPKAFRNSGLRTLRRTPEGTALQGLRATSARRTKERSTSAPWTSDICHIAAISAFYFSDSVQYLLPNRFDGFDSVWLSWFKLNQCSTVKLTLITIDWNSTDVMCLRVSQSPSYCSQCADSWLLPTYASRARSFPPKFRLDWLHCQVSRGVQAL